MPTAVAHFASRRADLTVIERPNQPQYENGRLVHTEPGRYHQFADHRCRIEGQKSIDFMRARSRAADGPEIWEIDASDVPSSEALLAELATADLARVRTILRAEQNGPARENVLATCRAVLEKMGAAERGPGAQAVHARHAVAQE